jgi:DHA2 family methylenomycin A resistance protein-like MFS transporter
MGGFVLGFAAAATFIAVESGTGAPMLPLHFFRRPGFTPAILFGVLVNFCYYGVIFVLSIYLQKVLGYSTIQAGFAFIPLSVTFIASNSASGWMAGRTGSRAPMVLGGFHRRPWLWASAQTWEPRPRLWTCCLALSWCQPGSDLPFRR